MNDLNKMLIFILFIKHIHSKLNKYMVALNTHVCKL